MDTFLLKRPVDWSLLTNGFHIPPPSSSICRLLAQRQPLAHKFNCRRSFNPRWSSMPRCLPTLLFLNVMSTQTINRFPSNYPPSPRKSSRVPLSSPWRTRPLAIRSPHRSAKSANSTAVLATRSNCSTTSAAR